MVATAFPTPPAATFTSTEQSAWTQLQQTLAVYGFSGIDLNDLVNWAKGELIAGKDSNQIALDLQTTAQFTRRFPAIVARRQAGLPPVSPAEYLSLESSYAQLERSAGIPPNWASYDALIANDVSPTEYGSRLNQGLLAVTQADPTVVKAFQDYYNVKPGQLAAWFLDPTKAEPMLLQQAAAAQVGGAAAASGFGEISSDEAARLARQGINYSQAQTGFQKLAGESQLFRGLPGQAEPSLTEAQLTGAQFGTDSAAAQALTRQAAYETGTTAQGTQVAQTSTGATGLGRVQR
jgi:hypothetical protein